MKNILLSAKMLTKSFGKANTAVLKSVNADIYKEDFTVIMGSSGAGKSTLLYALSGMDKPDSGSIRFIDTELTACSEKEMTKMRADNFGFVFQRTHLVSDLTLYENILLAGLVSGKLDEKRAKQRTDELISRMNLAEAKSRLPSAVSGGEAQRAAIARAVFASPDILFADEPTGALNKANSEEVLNLFSELSNAGQTVLLVTHDMQAALRGNRILYLEDGKISGELELTPYKGKDRSREEKLSEWLTELRW